MPDGTSDSIRGQHYRAYIDARDQLSALQGYLVSTRAEAFAAKGLVVAVVGSTASESGTTAYLRTAEIVDELERLQEKCTQALAELERFARRF